LFALRIAALTLVHLVLFAAVSGALLPAPPGQPAPDPAASLGGLLAVSVATTLVVAYVLRHARWCGWTLAAALFVVLYGVTTVMPQIESAFFLTRLPAGMLPRLFLAGAIVSAIYAPLAVRLLGRWRDDDVAAPSSGRLRLTASQWVVRLSIVVVAYLLLYFGFGYYVAWQSEAVRAYYGGTDPGGFIAQFRSVVRDTPLLVPLQVLRAVMWAGLGALVIRMTTGAWWTTALGVALLFSIVMTAPLLLPNPYMPRDVRLTHLVETASSNFIFGWVLVAVLLGRRGRTPMHLTPATAA
jgi:hypothetical protein